ncbi:MAG: hypothetical protein A2020_12255 [Lentisphaerae bacterium GWF2_45_14]|nr:MAG: hypothetical protein A2020_12255 [Lentisphaerae bacterium GWF2_45_14]
MNIEKIKKVILRERQKVLPCNLSNFDHCCKSYLEEIEERPFEVEELTKKLSDAIRHYQSRPSKTAPPRLCRQLSETPEKYVERIYSTKGYVTI